ncbi:heptaprenylglyceryl phosphate synthase [Gorillibacterium massiliense]|uniref:heptaprenylglyceryl phosphate synthase n=1 Tax=Gorillibacterium massiliense TaxID=1280390 RepID=UPI0004B32DD1|nr:heptaprenylglyceryl phosphate synthase [Gorillibacterium massiliense]
MVIKEWKHVFKLDPERAISDEALERLCLSGTDAIMVGGSTGITYDNTVDILSRVRRYEVPCVQEISAIEAVVPGFDLYFIPAVLNTDDARWMTGMHHTALRRYGSFMEWDKLIPEGYVILNDECTAAQLTGSSAPADAKDLTAYALMVDRLYRMPVFYVEYSGVFGNMEWVAQAKSALQHTRLFYGGGIRTAEQAKAAAAAADTIVVGNIIYENLEQALTTIQTKPFPNVAAQFV